MNEHTFKTMIATAEIVGAQLSESALEILADDLDAYSDEHLMIAFKRMRQDGAKFIPSEVIKRLPAMWMGAEQAWASFPRDEALSACVCQEMLDAWGVAEGLDDIAGRMAFKEAYTRSVSEAMALGSTPVWIMSMGSDRGMREQATLEAVAQGKLSSPQAHVYLPHMPKDEIESVATKQISATRLIENHAQTVTSMDQLLLESAPVADVEVAKSHLAGLRELLGAS